jgi:hypothetical protein
MVNHHDKRYIGRRGEQRTSVPFATNSVCAGNFVMISVPDSITTTSSSIRAAGVFTERLIAQRQASPHTIAAYRPPSGSDPQPGN